jgi:molybdopterin synthase sulfur carrier subunit
MIRHLASARADTMHDVATVRFFAQAREATGTGSVEVSGSTVEEVLHNAVAMYGSALSAVIEISKVWLNGEEVPHSHAVSDKDEVAVLPPVSGGI